MYSAFQLSSLGINKRHNTKLPPRYNGGGSIPPIVADVLKAKEQRNLGF